VPEYRYTLIREWLTGSGTVLWVMLNPSTADDKKDDPTVRKCIGFSKRWGFCRLVVVNLFAMRATDPRQLLWEIENSGVNVAEGPDNLDAFEVSLASADRVVAAWGAFAPATKQAESIPCLLSQPLYCIGRTQGGFPLHPSRAGYTAAPVLFREAL
jgi:hypothetical protein